MTDHGDAHCRGVSQIARSLAAGLQREDGCSDHGVDPPVRGVLRGARGRRARHAAPQARPRHVPTTRFRRRFSGRSAPTAGCEHGEHLRAWVLTIASRVAIDTHRRAGEHLPPSCRSVRTSDGGPAYEELAFLTDGLPPKERAAVVLRYGYDLTYDQIAAALDSSPDAARQAASSGVRARLRKEHDMTIPTDLDRRFRDTAVRSGLLDAGYDVSTRRSGRCSSPRPTAGSLRISFDPRSGARSSRRSRGSAGPRVLRAPHALDETPTRARRVLRGSARRASTSRLDLRGLTPLQLDRARRAREGPVRRDRDLRRARRARREAQGSARRRDGDEPQPGPDRAAVPPHRRRRPGSLVGYGGGLERKERLLRLEGAIL